MEQKYTRLIPFFLLLLWNFSVSGQLIANDDLADNVNNIGAGSGVVNALANDSLNGNAATPNNVIITQVSTTHPSIVISPNNGKIHCNSSTVPVGTYTIVYSICEIGNPGNCDTATVTVNVCSLAKPTLTVHPINDCNDAVGVTLGNLPAGPWTVTQRAVYGIPVITTYTGSGSSFVIDNLSPGNYYFSVINASGCTSAEKSSGSIGEFNENLFTYTFNGQYQDTNNDGIVNIGDAIFYQLSVTNVSACDMTLGAYDGQTVFTGPTMVTISPNATNNEITGYYQLIQGDINSGHVSNWWAVTGYTEGGAYAYTKAFTNTQLNIGDGFKLNAFLDNNSNGIEDDGELGYDYGIFNIEMNNNGVIHHIYSDTGLHTVYETNPLNTYSASYYVQNMGSCDYATAVSFPNITIPAGSGITAYNFPVASPPCTDVSVYLWASTPIPGFPYHNYVYYRNAGNTTIATGNINFTVDSTLTVSSVSESGAVMNPTGFTYNFTNLLPGEDHLIAVEMPVPPIPTVALGDLVTSAVNIAIPDSEVNVQNNTYQTSRRIAGSYDPNDITEAHGGKIVHADFSSEDYLTYTIRFENTGTANAFKIRVMDVLDEKLDETSVSMVASSHHYVLDRVDNNLEWRFDGINLPPSVENTDTGKGYIVFQVKPKPGYAIGDIIPNAAEIYFDFNPAIVTNTFNTEFTAPLSVANIEDNLLSLYPNPVKDKLNINSTQNIQTVSVYNLPGQQVLEKRIDAVSGTLDLSGLGSGVYLVRVKSAEAVKTIKIVIE